MGELNLKDALVHLGGSVSLYRTLLQGFQDKYSSIDNDIKTHLLDREIEDARRLAHSMKGLSGNLGATELQRYSKNLEEVIKSYIGIDILENEIDAILGKEWIQFSEELHRINRNIKLVLDASDEKLLSIDTTKQLIDEHNNDKLKDLKEINVYTKELLLNESKSSVQSLLRTLGTYNYESINMALANQDEEVLRKCCNERWDKVLSFIHEFEYDLAKEELLEGVLDEK